MRGESAKFAANNVAMQQIQVAGQVKLDKDAKPLHVPVFIVRVWSDEKPALS